MDDFKCALYSLTFLPTLLAQFSCLLPHSFHLCSYRAGVLHSTLKSWAVTIFLHLWSFGFLCLTAFAFTNFKPETYAKVINLEFEVDKYVHSSLGFFLTAMHIVLVLRGLVAGKSLVEFTRSSYQTLELILANPAFEAPSTLTWRTLRVSLRSLKVHCSTVFTVWFCNVLVICAMFAWKKPEKPEDYLMPPHAIYLINWYKFINYFHPAYLIWISSNIALLKIGYCLAGDVVSAIYESSANHSMPEKGLVNLKAVMYLIRRLDRHMERLNSKEGVAIAIDCMIFAIVSVCSIFFTVFWIKDRHHGMLVSTSFTTVLHLVQIYNLARFATGFQVASRRISDKLQMVAERVRGTSGGVALQAKLMAIKLAAYPAEITPNGFFTINKKMITNIANAMTTYLILLVQFRDVERQSPLASSSTSSSTTNITASSDSDTFN